MGNENLKLDIGFTSPQVNLPPTGVDTRSSSDPVYLEAERRVKEYRGKREVLAKRIADLFKATYGRNKSLGKLIYLRMAVNHMLPEELAPWPEIGDLRSYQGRRGKKEMEMIPLKLIMKILGCSRRSAQDFQTVSRADALIENGFELIIQNMRYIAVVNEAAEERREIAEGGEINSQAR